jgi:proline iminopeptidase
MRERYPSIEPHATGMLDVGDGHAVYWDAAGRPDGKPALIVHGGPGSGSWPGTRRYFDPDVYRIIQFDQRGCGRSTPHAGEPSIDLSVITTDHLVADIERLRETLDIDRWLVFGGSWGCALGLVYAQRHPDRVSEMVLLALATGRRTETELLTRGLRGYFPRAWEDFAATVPEAERDGDLAAAYARLLQHEDAGVRDAAARAWCAWEDAIMPMYPPNPDFEDPSHRLAFARLVTHFWSHGSWLEEGEVLHGMPGIASIPAVLVQGVLDPGNLLGTPWELSHAWPASELVLVDDAGHGFSDAGMVDALVTATDRFRRPG